MKDKFPSIINLTEIFGLTLHTPDRDPREYNTLEWIKYFSSVKLAQEFALKDLRDYGTLTRERNLSWTEMIYQEKHGLSWIATDDFISRRYEISKVKIEA